MSLIIDILLMSGAWINPFYTKGGSFPSTSNTVTFSLASVTSWDQTTDPSYGFTKEKVSYFRAQANKANVLISFGGATASESFWPDMAAQVELNAEKIEDFLTSVGADGIDYDYVTGMSSSVSIGLASIMQILSSKGFTQTLSCVPSFYSSYKPIIDANIVKHITVLCFGEGGMFTPDHPSGNKGWEAWMDDWVQKVGDAQKGKLLTGMCIQLNDGIEVYADLTMVAGVVAYSKAKGTGGAVFWLYSDNAQGAGTIGPLIDLVSN